MLVYMDPLGFLAVEEETFTTLEKYDPHMYFRRLTFTSAESLDKQGSQRVSRYGQVSVMCLPRPYGSYLHRQVRF